MQTQERPRTEPLRPRDQRPRWLVPALAGALAVVIAIAAAALLQTGGSSEPDVIEPAPTPTTLPAAPVLSPLEVTGLYNEAVAADDWAALRALYADTAEFEVNSVSGETFVERVPLADLVPQTPHDWDGDGLVNGFDAVIDDAAKVAAHGTTTFVSCSQVDEITAACEEVWEGHAFQTPNVDGATTWTVTITDGVISSHVLEVSPRSQNPIDSDLVGAYNTWINDNRPELEAELFEDSITLSISPDTVPVHRELVAEWQATTRTAADVGEALNAAAAAGDWETVVGLFAEDATITLGPGNLEFEGSTFPRAGSVGSGFGPAQTGIGDFLTGDDWLGSFSVVDWDGDSVRNGFDSLAQDTMVAYAMGFSVFESCRADDPSTLVCVGVWDAHPFPNPGRGEEVAIHTVVDGLITDTTWDIEGVNFGNNSPIDRLDANDYAKWVNANRPEFTEDAELFQSSPGDPVIALVMSQDSVEIHRQLIAEWVAQR